MAQTVSVVVGAEDRARMAAVVGDRNRPHKHVQRAKIVLLSAQRLPVLTVAFQLGVHIPMIATSRSDRSRPLVPKHRDHFVGRAGKGA